MSQTAVVLANGHFETINAKTAHGLVRGPSRYEVRAVVDADCVGKDAGVLVDGRHRGIPIVRDLASLLASGVRPDVCAVGVATHGGVLPEPVRADLRTAARAGMTLVNGLHKLLGDDPELAALAEAHGATILDVRRPRPVEDLRFWSGEILALETPRVAVLGTDCAIGKRTTAGLLCEGFAARGVRAEMIYTGQTGWFQGYRYGFLFDATPNDFVCGELEGAVLDCAREADPDVILLEGQSALRNPMGPCGAELLLPTATAGVVLQHAPGRPVFEGLEHLGCKVPTVAEEIELIHCYGVPVWVVTLNPEGLDDRAARATRDRLEDELGIPVVLPVADGIGRVADVLVDRLGVAPAGGETT